MSETFTKEEPDEKYARIRRCIEAMMNGATPIKCSCGVTHFQMREELRNHKAMKCHNCEAWFDLLGPLEESDV